DRQRTAGCHELGHGLGLCAAEIVEPRVEVVIPAAGRAAVAHQDQARHSPASLSSWIPGGAPLRMNHSVENARANTSTGIRRKKPESVTWLACIVIDSR